MKQIIDGLLYDTENADLIHSEKIVEWYEFGAGARQETLYKTNRGRYFLLREPFRMSMQKTRIIPLMETQARGWLQDRSGAPIDAYRTFGIEVKPA